MKVLVLNCGSSSLKYQIIDTENEDVLAKGKVARIPIDGTYLEIETDTEKKIDIDVDDHGEAIEKVFEQLVEEKVIESLKEIDAVGHRVVHGGEKFKESVLIDEEVVEQLEKVSDLAPLHNPHNISGIRACQEKMPETPMAAVFDTAFHQTMDEKAFLYGIPYEYYEKHGIRTYGFHGTSHRFVAKRCADLLDKDLEDMKIVTCHLGNGASIAAVKGGKSIDTSMGLTPLEGLLMGTRSGDVDPAVIPFLMEKEDMTHKEVEEVLNNESGLIGLSQVSSNHKDICDAAEEGDKQARMALDVFDYRVKKYIGSYAAAMGGIDAVVFTGGIGENSIETRESVLEGMEFMGLELDQERNDVRGEETEITSEGSENKAFLIPTNEELVIARDTAEIVKRM